MKATWIKAHFVAGNYTITKGNIWGPTSRLIGRGSLDEAKRYAIENARQNQITDVFIRVGGGEWKALSL